MRAFPVSDDSWLVDRCNHFVVSNHLRDNFSRENWRVVYDESQDWIEVDDDTEESKFVNEMLEASKKYPPLDEHEYHRLEYIHKCKAIDKLGKRSGTIILHTDSVLALLYESSISIVETSPMCYEIVIGDKEFRNLVEETFPEWKLGRESWMC